MRYWLDDIRFSSHRFKHLSTIRRSIADLHRCFPGPTLLGTRFPSSLSPAIVEVAKSGDAAASARRIVGVMIHHFHLREGSVAVRFSNQLEVPARISQTAGGNRLVEIQSAFAGTGQIVAIMAHEIAHFFLDTHQLEYADDVENEILTDTTANYLGAGWSTLNAFERLESTSWNGLSTTTTTRESKLGYLTPEEFGYVLARRCKVTKEDIRPWIKRKEGRAALSAGLDRLRCELGQPPLATAGMLRRLRYKLAVWRSTAPRGDSARIYDYGPYSIEAAATKNVVFYCPRCTQQLRLPVGVKLAVVSCQCCRHRFECAT